MTPQALNALHYVSNAGGYATAESFMDDHEPVGHLLWQELRYPVSLIQHDRAEGRSRYLVLTEEGFSFLQAEDAKP